ncbi:MAG: NAD-dependent epimerase/dehydratase family protein [Chitinophagales bacterium]
MQKIIVTGAAGHIGFNVAKILLQKNYEVHLLVRSINVNVIELENLGAKIHTCNLFDVTTYKDVIAHADCLFHLAAENTTSMQHAARVVENADKLTQVVLQACLYNYVKTVIYTSSVVVIGRSSDANKPLNENDENAFAESPYVHGKMLAEKFVEKFTQENKYDVRRVYPVWTVGSGDPKLTPPHKVIKDYLEKGTPVYFDGGICVAAVEEIAKGHVAAYEKGKPNEKYILGGENITFKEFYQILSANSHQKMPFLKLPKFMIYIASWIFTKAFKIFGKEFPISPEYVTSVVGNYSWYDCSKAKNELGYETKPAQEILKNAVQDANRKILGVQNLGKKTIRFVQSEQPVQLTDNSETLLITGVPGWLGNRMIDILINGDRFGNHKSNRKVRILLEPRFRNLLSLPENYEIVYADITNIDQVRAALQNVTTVFHLAGAIYPKNIDILYKVNEQGTKNIVDACIENNIRRIVFMSTDSTCGHGTKTQKIFDENTIATPYKNYGQSKYLAEQYILDKTAEGKIDGTSLRGFWFFGPFAPARQLTFVNMFYWPRQLVFGNGKNLRSISHIDNIIEAFFQVENNPATFGNWYWIGNDQPHPTVDDIYKEIATALNVEYKPLYIPKIVCRCFELLDTVLGKFNYLHPTVHAAGKFDYDIAGNIDKAKRDFNYKPKVALQDAAEELKEMTS